MSGSIAPQPYDPQAVIQEFLQRPDPKKHLVVRTEKKGGDRVTKVFYTDKLTLKEKAQLLLGIGSVGTEKLVKALIIHGFSKEDLDKVLNARTQRVVARALTGLPLYKPSQEDVNRKLDKLVADVATSAKHNPEMRKRLLDAFQLTADPQANEEKRKLILNYLKMGITIPANADCRIGTKRDNLFSKSFSPLGLACNRGWADVVEQVLSRDPSRLPDERLQRVADAELNLALRQPKLDVNVITALIGGGANIFKSDIHGDTPFDNLVRYNREREKVKAILKMMIETGKLDPNIQHKNRPLFALLQKDTVGEFLLEQTAKGKSALLLAVRTPDCLKMIQTWCKSHPDAVITDRGREGKSVLAIAKSDNPEVIPYLENLMVLRLKNDPSLIEHLTSDMLERALQIAEGSKDAALVKALKQAQSNRNAEKG